MKPFYYVVREEPDRIGAGTNFGVFRFYGYAGVRPQAVDWMGVTE